MQQMCVKVRCERSNSSRKGALQGGCGGCTHRQWHTGGPIELRDGHFEVTEIVELTQRQKAEWVVQQQHLSHARTRGGGGMEGNAPRHSGTESQVNRRRGSCLEWGECSTSCCAVVTHHLTFIQIELIWSLSADSAVKYPQYLHS